MVDVLAPDSVIESARVDPFSLVKHTNLPFADWTSVFGNERLTAALLDRLTHRCHILEFRTGSFRLRQSLHAQSTKTNQATATEKLTMLATTRANGETS